MKGSLLLFATDLLDEGVEHVLSNAQERGRLQGVTMACNYHHSRDVFPHNPVRKVHFFTGGVYFRVDRRRYERLLIKPDVSPLLREADPLAAAIEGARRRGMAARGWTNNMHSTALGSAWPECAVENAFGDRYITTLCPANPDVRAYVCALASDLARYELDTLMVESVCYMPFEHGYHHERLMIPVPAAARYLLGVCFCQHCMQVANRCGVDAARLRDHVREQLDRALNGESSELDDIAVEREAIAEVAGGEMAGLLEAREQVVRESVGQIVEAVRDVKPMPVVVMEWSGGLRGAGMGMPVPVTSAPALDRAWQDGVGLSGIVSQADGIVTLGYVRDLEAFRVDLNAYRLAVPPGKTLAVAVRPMPPDCDSLYELSDKLGLLQAGGVDWVEFYHYALMRLQNLDWIGQAMGNLAA
jgi:hypothetical protein